MCQKTLIALVACLFIGTGISQAAQILETGKRLNTVQNCSLQIEGRITAGDAAKIKAILQNKFGLAANRRSGNTPPDAERIKTVVACLSGPGGSYLEGIKMGEVFANYGVATLVPDNKTCESACAIAFLGGKACCDAAGKPVVQRYLYPGSKIGFHAPSLNLSGATKYSRESALKAYDLGLEAVAKLRQNATLFSINEVFMSKIFDHRGQNFYYIKTLDDAEFTAMLLTGYRATRLKRDTFQAACWNAWNWYVAGQQRHAGFTTSEHWKNVFKGASGHAGTFSRGLYVFYPFDGSANCLVRETRRNGKRMLRVVISEGNVSSDPDPLLRGYFRSTLLLRGNRTLKSTR